MQVLVAGASGVLGQPTVRELLAAGHDVIGLARDDRAAKIIQGLGARVARGDLLDRDAVATAVSAALEGVEGVVHVAGALPVGKDPRKSGWEQMERVWRQGTENLLLAARRADVQVFVHASLGLLYGENGESWVTEETALARDSLIEAARDAEKTVQAAADDGLPVVMLRMGTVYSRDAWHTRLLAQQARQRSLVIVGDGKAFWSLIHADDAGHALARAVDDAEAGTIYNVADDHPVQMGDLMSLIARLSGSPQPSRVPALIARAVVGSDVVSLLTTSIRLSNRAIRQDLELNLHYPNCEEGLRQVLSEPLTNPD